MPYFAVGSGNIFRCVCADDERSACVIAIKSHIKCCEKYPDAYESPHPGLIFQTHEFGQDETVLILAEFVFDAGGFKKKWVTND